MKRILKYLLPVVLAVVFWNCTDTPASSVPEEGLADFQLVEMSCHSSLSATESEFCPPRQVSFANSQRVQSAPRRTAGANRTNLEFTKSGKVINACLRYVIQRKSIIVHSSLIEPSHRLLYLGKLII